jgi:hypothetical protein
VLALVLVLVVVYAADLVASMMTMRAAFLQLLLAKLVLVTVTIDLSFLDTLGSTFL